jgi:glycopeptide antibiotics resistance protein
MKYKSVAVFFLLVYIRLLFKVLVFKDVPLIKVGGLMFDFGGAQAGEPNLVPFKTIWPYLTGEFGLLIGGLNIVGNIIFLIPLGLLLPKLFSRINQLRVLLIAVLFCLAIELTQVYFKIGIFDIDDVLLNVLGVMVGYWMVVYLPVVWEKMKADRKWMAGVILLSSLVTLLSVYSIVESLKPPAMGMGGAINKPQQLDSEGASQTGDKDLCAGSGGTGVLLTVDSSVITIRRKDDVVQEIKLNPKTVIKASSGEIRVGNLKPGNRVTLVIDESETAALVLVCGG